MDGTFAGRLKFDAPFFPCVLRGDRVYGITRDRFDVQNAVIYQISRH